MKVFAVRDSALGEFMNPFVAPSAGIATRSFSDEVNRKDSPISAHPSDFELFELGEYDAESGRIISLSSPKSLVRAQDVLIREESGSLRAVK